MNLIARVEETSWTLAIFPSGIQSGFQQPTKWKKKNEQEKQQKLSLDECLVCLTENSYAVYRDNQSLSLNAFDRNFTRITALINLIWLHKFIYGIIDAIDILKSISLLC